MITRDPTMAAILTQYGSQFPGKKQQTISGHTNPGLELVYIAKGEVTWQYEEKNLVSPAGTLSFTWPGQYHGSASPLVPVSEMHWLILKMEKEKESPSPELGMTDEENRRVMGALGTLKPQIIGTNERIRFYFMQIMAILNEEPTDRGRIELALHLRLLLAEISRQPPLRGELNSISSETEHRVTRFLERLKDECAESWNLGDMCTACGVGRTRFASLVRKHTGESPMKTLNRYRIERAREMLLNTDKPITRIAFDCGFPSSQYFAGVFRAYNDMTPRDYRKQS